MLYKTGFGNGAGFGGFGNQNAGAGDRPRVSEMLITVFKIKTDIKNFLN